MCYAFVSYIQGNTEQISRIFGIVKTKKVFKNLFCCWVNDWHNAIYSIQCNDSVEQNDSLGEKNRLLAKKENTSLSRRLHVCQTNHTNAWDNFKIITTNACNLRCIKDVVCKHGTWMLASFDESIKYELAMSIDHRYPVEYTRPKSRNVE